MTTIWEQMGETERGIVEVDTANSRHKRMTLNLGRVKRQVVEGRLVEYEHIERAGGDEFGLYHPRFVLVGKASTGDLMLSDGNTFNALVNLQAGVEIQNPNNLNWQNANFRMNGPKSRSFDDVTKQAQYSWGYTAVGQRSQDAFAINLLQLGRRRPKFDLSYTNNSGDPVVARFWMRLTPVRRVQSLRYLHNKRLSGRTSGGQPPLRSDDAVTGLEWDFGNLKRASFGWFDFYENDLIDPAQQILAPLDSPQAPSTIVTLPLVVGAGQTVTIDPDYTETAPGWSVDIEENGEWSSYVTDSSEWLGHGSDGSYYRVCARFDIANASGFDNGDTVDSVVLQNWNVTLANGGSRDDISAGPYDGDGVGSESPELSDNSGSTDTSTAELWARCDTIGRADEYLTGISPPGTGDWDPGTLGATAAAQCCIDLTAARTGAAGDYFAIAMQTEEAAGINNWQEVDEFDEGGAPDLVITWTEAPSGPPAGSLVLLGVGK